jgi:hypothetical protein
MVVVAGALATPIAVAALVLAACLLAFFVPSSTLIVILHGAISFL